MTFSFPNCCCCFSLTLALVLPTWQTSGPGCHRWTSDGIISTGESRDAFIPSPKFPISHTYTRPHKLQQDSLLTWDQENSLYCRKKKQVQTFIWDKVKQHKTGLGHINKIFLPWKTYLFLLWNAQVTTDNVTNPPHSFTLKQKPKTKKNKKKHWAFKPVMAQCSVITLPFPSVHILLLFCCSDSSWSFQSFTTLWWTS